MNCEQIGVIEGGNWDKIYDCCRRVYSTKGISPTLNTRGDDTRAVKIMEKSNVRRLTPKEYWKLMGFTDDDFEKAQAVCSDTQLYKQAGNSIVVNVLEAVLKNLLGVENENSNV